MDERRNLNPTPEAIVAMCIWGFEYSKQRLGVMDWFDELSAGRQRQSRDLAQRITDAAKKHGEPTDRFPTHP